MYSPCVANQTGLRRRAESNARAIEEGSGWSKFQTLVETIQDRASRDENGILFISGDKQEEYVSYRKLLEQALQVLHELQEQGVKPGDELIIQIDDNDTFLNVFLGLAAWWNRSCTCKHRK